MLRGRRIVLGVGGSVAAYKAAELARLLVREGAEVRSVLTAAGGRFVRPRLLSALTGQPCATGLFGRDAPDHVRWAEWAEAGVVAPCTADLLAKAACGLADDFLSTWMLAFPGPLVVAPAMNRHMWAHPAVARNVARLREDGAAIVPPEYGDLASGEGRGWGRLASPEAIAACLRAALAHPRPLRQASPAFGTGELAGRRVVVTAGPTREALDPVRFLTNASSGRMGFAMVQAAAEMGACVTLVAGPTEVPPPEGAETVRVTTTLDMLRAVLAAAPSADLVVFAAAPADWRPAEASATKRKKAGSGDLTIPLVANPDIAAEVGKLKGRHVLVGFAAEAGAGLEEAERKLRDKGLHLCAFNDVREAGAGFGTDTNHVILVDRQGGREEIGPASKLAVARRILERAAALLPAAE